MKDTKLSKNFFSTLHRISLQSTFPGLSYSAGNLLHKLMKSPSLNPDKKVESLNKNLLLSIKCDIEFGKDTISLLSKVTKIVNNFFEENIGLRRRRV